MILKIYNKK